MWSAANGSRPFLLACAWMPAAESKLRVGFDHLFRVPQRRIGQFGATQHSRNLFRALLALDLADRSPSPATHFLFRNQVMMIGEGCDLRQVSDANNLMHARQFLQLLSYSFGSTASNAGVDFVKHQRPLGRTTAFFR